MALTQVTSAMLEPNAQYMGFKNRIINGAMGIWQRGTSGFSASAYGPDRFIVAGNSGLTAAQSSDVPSGFKYSLSLSATGFPQATQRIESANCIDLVGQTVTVSFWAKQTSGAGSASLAVAIYYADAVDYFSGGVTTIATTTFTGTSSWAKYTATFTSLPASVTNGIQVTVFGNTAGAATFLTTGVQLEKGSTATSFDYRPYGTELQLCQRYFAKSYEVGTAPATATVLGMVQGGIQFASGLGGAWQAITWPVRMRATPSTTIWDSAGAQGYMSYYYGAAGSSQSIATSGTGWGGLINASSCGMMFPPTASQPNAVAFYHYTASAEL